MMKWVGIFGILLGPVWIVHDTEVVFPTSTTASTAEYMVTFESTWSATTHPQGFPSGAHFSGLIGATHTAAVSFWDVGGDASLGIKNMAETGSKGSLSSEVDSAIEAGTAENLLSGGGINPSPGSVSLTFTITDAYPLVTLVSMLAPSPDWFVGVSGLSLFENESWVEQAVVELYAYDAGTDSGITYAASNQATDPPEAIARIETEPFLVDNAVVSVGTFTFTRISATAVEDEPSEVPATHVLSAAYPNPFNPEAAFTLTLQQAQPVRIDVYDVNGRRVDTLFDGPLSSGTPHRFTITAEGWPSGVYIYRVMGETFLDSRAVLLVK